LKTFTIFRRPALLFLLFLLAAAGSGSMVSAHADGQIFLCTDASGHKELTDANRSGNCRLLDLPGAITSPPKQPAGTSRAPAPAVSPANFPKVDSAQQKARDADRRAILQDELASEQQKLADLQKEYNNGEPERQGNERNYAKYQERVANLKDNISRAEKNIEALQREIANIR
jgi:predicted lipid-binding transport protein (Tim44 family)